MKKFLNIILIAILTVTVALGLTACVGGGDDGKDKGLLCKRIDGVYTIYDYVDDGTTTELDIASKIPDGETKVHIRAEAFKGVSSLKKIVVPQTVTEIGKGAFANMRGLEELVLPFVGKSANADAYQNQTATAEDKAIDSERTISHLFGSDFYGYGTSVTIRYNSGESSTSTCYVPLSLKKITINASAEYDIPMYAFSGFTKAVEIALTGNIVGIGEYAFSDCLNLDKITIPQTVKTIYKGAFEDCSKLKTVTFDGTPTIETLGDCAFKNAGIESITLPESVKVIGNEAFKGSKLKAITLPAAVTDVKDEAFFGCESLENVFVNGIFNIGVYAFADCDNLNYFGKLAEKTDKLVNLVGFTKVESQAFDGFEGTIKRS